MKHFPDAKLGFGPPTEDGFYYDFDFGDEHLDAKDLKIIQKSMYKIIREGQEFSRLDMSEEEAIQKAREIDQPYKISQIENLKQKGVDSFSYYINGSFADLCEGPHVKNTSELDKAAFKLDSIAGAYWLGSEKNKMLTRIYAFAFPSEEELSDYLERRKLAQERDHKKLGKELDIFFIDSMVGKGLPIWLPAGTVIRDTIEDYAKEMEFRYGYKRVATPHIAKSDLYYTSQHLPAYQDSMFPAMTLEEPDEEGGTVIREEYYLKPMNCPHHHRIFDHKPVSYRQLPMRLTEYGTCYRFEQTGELSGLLRVRMLSMNDAHIYLAENQLQSEIRSLLQMYKEYYDTFGLKNFRYRLSLKGDGNKDKFKGDDELWDRAGRYLREGLEELNIPYEAEEGEAAFYGPKIDIQFKNLLGREETVSTIQVDFLAAINFKLRYTGEDGQEHSPVVIHRAPLSTHERLISFLIEYYGGAFPVWCSPVQVMFIPVADTYMEFAKKLRDDLRSGEVRAEVDDSTNSFNKKIRNNVKRKIPILIIVGQQEQDNGEVTVRRYGVTDQKTVSFSEFRTGLIEEIKTRAKAPHMDNLPG